jgi:hypothetical protein
VATIAGGKYSRNSRQGVAGGSIHECCAAELR